MNRKLLLVAALIAASTAYAGGGNPMMVRMEPVKKGPECRLIPVLALYTTDVRFDGPIGQIQLAGWDDGKRINPTRATDQAHGKWKYIIFPVKNLQLRQCHNHGEPAIRFKSSELDEVEVDLMLVDDHDVLWRKPLNLHFGALKQWPTGPYRASAWYQTMY